MISPDDGGDVTSQQVRAFIKVLSKEYGVSEQEIEELFDTLRWATSYKRRMRLYGVWTAKTLLLAIVGGGLLAFWEGFKHFLEKAQ